MRTRESVLILIAAWALGGGVGASVMSVYEDLQPTEEAIKLVPLPVPYPIVKIEEACYV